MHAEILTIGSELLSGATVNTNAAYLARRLAEVGIACKRQVAVGDERANVLEALRDALARSELVIATGGLGPTFDDVTMEVIAQAAQRPLTDVPFVASQIRRFYTRRHRALQRAALRQARLPRGGVALFNPIGTAPGLWLPLPDAVLIALPGVPSEMRAIMERSILPRLARMNPDRIIENRTLRAVGIVELSIERILRTLRIPANVQVGLYPHLRAVDVRLTATASTAAAAREALARVERPLRHRLGLVVYGDGGDTLAGVVGSLLVQRHQTLAVAESCTGGLVSSWITDVSGSSRYLRGAVVAYHNDLKRHPLDVSVALLARAGVVSAPVAKAMAVGVRRVAEADIGLSITGIAGPTGATRTKPVGLVFFGLADGRSVQSLRCQFFGDRESVRTQAAQTALDWLRRCLLEPVS